MNSQIYEKLGELPRLLVGPFSVLDAVVVLSYQSLFLPPPTPRQHAIEQPRDPETRRDATEQVRRFLSVDKDPPIQIVVRSTAPTTFRLNPMMLSCSTHFI